MNNEVNNNQVQQQATLEPISNVTQVEQPNVTEQPKNYEQQVNDLLNSVTMADLVDPNAKNSKSKKTIILAVVGVICFISLVGVILLSTGTLSFLGTKTTSELDVFKTETTAKTIEVSKNVGKYTREVNNYTLDTSNAENGVTISYYLTTQVTLTIKYADDYDSSHKFTVNVNNSSYNIEQEKMGTLIVNISTEYIVYSNSEYEEQIVLSKNGLKFEEDPQVDPGQVEVTTVTTTTTTVPVRVEYTHVFENTTGADGRTTSVISIYNDPSMAIDFVWVDEDGEPHIVYVGSEESRLMHPELYTTTQAN